MKFCVVINSQQRSVGPGNYFPNRGRIMWTSTASTSLKKGFDDAIEIAYGNGQSGELENLSDLFSPRALDGYQQALLTGLDALSDASIDVAWIDKRPIAKLTKNGAGAELGDMMLVVHERDSVGFILKSRACLLEVKQSPDDPIPPVPVTDGKSTKNQFEILSKWPTLYGLKATGTNRTYLLQNVTTHPSATIGGVIAQAWYVAVKPKSKTSVPTAKPWMVAPAVLDANFEHTLGDLFQACAQGSSLYHSVTKDVGVGREFSRELRLQNPPSWDALINAIISVCERYTLPEHLFGPSPGKRYLRSYRPPIASFAIFPWLNIATLSNTVISLVVGFMVAWWLLPILYYRRRSRSPYREFLLGSFGCVRRVLKWRRKSFPVLIFNVFHGDKEQRSEPVR